MTSFAVQLGRAPLEVRKDDLYETPEEATRALLAHEPVPDRVWECACGPGAIVRVLREAGRQVVATDLVNYDCPDSDAGVDFLMEHRAPERVEAIVTNPPFKLADQFVRHGLRLVPRVIVLLRLAALEGAGRSDIIEGHLVRVWLGRERLPFMHRHGYEGPKNSNSGAPFAWFVFDRWKPAGSPIALTRISWRSA